MRMDRDRWAWLALVSSLLVAALASTRDLWATDLGWQLAAGRWILAHGWPSGDALSWTVPGAPWIEPRWLWCVTLASLWDGAGAGSVVLLSAALHTSAFAIALRARLTPSRMALGAALVLLATLTASQRLFARPEAVSYLLFAVFLAAIDADRRRPSPRVLALVALQVLWANAHSLFPLGPVLLAASAAVSLPRALRDPEERRRVLRHGALALAAGAVSLLNPWGIETLRLALTFAGQVRAGAAHDLLPELAGAATFGLRYVATAAAAATALTLLGLAVRAPRRLDPFLAAAVALGAVAGWSSIRNLPLFALAAIPFGLALSPETAAASPRRAARLVPALLLAACAALAWSLVTGRFFTWQRDSGSTGFSVAEHRYPEAVARAVAALPAVEGRRPRVWATMLESNWLLTEGVPSHFDTRIEPFGEARLSEHVAALAGGEAWRRMVQRDDIEVAVVSLEATDLIRALAAERSTWRAFAMDGVAVAFARTDRFGESEVPALVLDRLAASLVRSLETRSDPSGLGRAVPAARWHRVGGGLFQLGRADLAERFLVAALDRDPGLTATRLTLANVVEALGRAEEAFDLRREAYRRDPRDADALTQFAVDLLVRGRLLDLEPALARASERFPSHALTWALLGEARALQGRRADAIACLQHALRLQPEREQFRRRLDVIRSVPR